MTILDYLKKSMNDRGLSDVQSSSVILRLEKSNPPLFSVLNKAVEGYPGMFLVVALSAVDNEVVRWMDEHFPKHRAREMFTKEGTRKEHE